jgi:hypothetical protein
MDTSTLGVIGFVVALVLTPVYLLIFVKGVRSLSDIRDTFTRPPGDRRSGRRERQAERGNSGAP